jgi:TrmH family RNA methyltransferase
MITLRKLSTLREGPRLRKAAELLRLAVEEMVHGRPFDRVYLKGLGKILEEAESLPSSLRLEASALGDPVSNPSLLRLCDSLHYHLLDHLGVTPGDWDFRNPETGNPSREARRVLPLAVYLEDLRSPFNVGSIFRTAECFGAASLLLSPGTPTPDHPRVRRTAMGADSLIPWTVRPLTELEPPYVFILELGGTPLQDFAFPPGGTVILGSEELGVSPEAAALAEKGAGRVSIPLLGAKGSLNVAVAFGILMQAWSSSAAGAEGSV